VYLPRVIEGYDANNRIAATGLLAHEDFEQQNEGLNPCLLKVGR
jgi:hypothetical protein